MKLNQHPLLRFVRHVLACFFQDKCPQVAASLTYTTLLSLVPLVTIALTMVTAFPAFREFTSHLDDFLVQNMLPESVGRTVGNYIEQFTQKAASLTAVGIAFLAVTATLLMLTIERAFNSIWRVVHSRTMAQRVAIYWAVLILGPVLIGASISMTSYLVSMSLGFAREIPFMETLLLGAMPFLFTILAFTLLYYLMPQRPVELRHALIGGIVAGVLFELMKRGFALYVAKAPTYAMVYGAFAAVPIFLLWIYLSWVVALLGAEVAALIPEYRYLYRPHEFSAGAAFCDALELLRALIRAQPEAKMLSLAQLAEEAKVTQAAAEILLETMSKAGWATRTANHWALTCDPDVVRLAEVYRLFLLSPEVRDEVRGEAEIEAVLARLDTGAEAALDLPLRVLASPTAA